MLNSAQRKIALVDPKLPRAVDVSYPAEEVGFPFDRTLSENDSGILTKILFVNYEDSTQVKNKNIKKLVGHIQSVMGDKEWTIIRAGELTDEYFEVVERISHGHRIKSNPGNDREDDLTSFASKFCAKHNQKAPFWDNDVHELLKYWGFPAKYRNYPDYVNALRQLRDQQELGEFSLRHIEGHLWKIMNRINSGVRQEDISKGENGRYWKQ